MPSSTRVSVLIPAYNIASYVPDALESVLAQTHTNLEVIVINNGSEDNTAQVLKPYQDRVHIETFVENQGIAGAYNRGLEVATGDYIACLDGDDYYIYPQRIADQAAILDENPDAEIVCSGWQKVHEDGALQQEFRPWEQWPEFDPANWLMNAPFVLQAMLIRREMFTRVGNFKPRYSIAAGNYISLRMVALGARVAWYRQVTAAHRFRENSISQVQIPQQIEAEINSRIELFALDEVPPHIKAVETQAMVGHSIICIGRLFRAGYSAAEAALYVQIVVDHMPKSGIMAACNALTQLCFNLDHEALTEDNWHGMLDTLSESLPQTIDGVETRAFLRWWQQVWWVYADNLYRHPLSSDEHRRTALEHLHKYDASQVQGFAKAALKASPWALSDSSLRQFARDINQPGFVRRAYRMLIPARMRQGGVRTTLQALAGFLRG